METALIVKVAVNAAPYSIDKPYDYLVPKQLEEIALPGVRVAVPFGRGNRTSEGIILARNIGPKEPKLKPLLSVLDQTPVLDSDGIALALWMRQRYFCTLYDAVKTILPAGLWYHFRETWRLADGIDLALAREQSIAVQHSEQILTLLSSYEEGVDIDVLRNTCGEDTTTALWSLQKLGFVSCETSAKRKIHDKTRRIAELAISAEDALALMEAKRRSAPMRWEVVQLLASTGRASCADICYFTGASMQTLKGLEKAGILTFTQEETLRIPVYDAVQKPADPIVLNEEQQAAYLSILEKTHSGKAEAVLLHGVTGSGKTQVYLQLVQEILRQGKTAMVLVPEIVLTPQMMQKFSLYLGDKVVMLHSSLRMTERYDQWKRIARGEVQVVLGTRSAIFAPLKNLGLIILDEEQEGSYQSENPPRYHTRDVAKFLCARDKAVLLLGSATPSVESFWSAENGNYHKVVLNQRYNALALPQVVIADLRQEIRNGNPSLISIKLQQELEQNLERGEQSILFLNRRGSSRMFLCGECGHVPECPRCSVPLTYHSANGRMMCHYCGHSEKAPERCPQCGAIMKHVGVGTQKVEEELRDMFPGVGILRMDADTVTGGHEAVLKQFATEKVPILLGTQMVAKGLDFENVTLVGVLSADISLYLDHYRAAERTFDLLTQVVGRAGRGGKMGRAVIQTYTPENDVIASAAQQDYVSFYENEIRLRRLRRSPPFADLFTFTVSGVEEGRVLRAAVGVREQLCGLAQLPELAASQPEVLGPAPAPILKVNNRYRYRILLVGRNDKVTREKISWILKTFSRDPANRGLNIFVDYNTWE